MEKVFLTSVRCQYLILETTESTGTCKFIHNARHYIVIENDDNTAVSFLQY